jgi:hypothetical protein
MITKERTEECGVPCQYAPHALRSVSGSPTGYRFGFDSPTRLVRFGLASAATISGSVGVDGALPFDAPCVPAASWAGSAVFFRRPRAGFGATSGVGSDAWTTLAGSGRCSVASTFLRDLVFLTTGFSASGREATWPVLRKFPPRLIKQPVQV